MKKVLVITYYWPPSGGSGVQRWLKMAKYLPQFGWEPVVYTPLNPDVNSVDESLLEDVSPELKVIRKKIVEPYGFYKILTGKKKGEHLQANLIAERFKNKSGGWAERISGYIRANWFIPDPRVWWIKPSVRFLKKHIMSLAPENRPSAVISTGPPHSMHLIAKTLHKNLGIPWIADFRDPWTNIFYFKHLGLSKKSLRKHKALERGVLEEADKIVVVSSQMQKEFAQSLSCKEEGGCCYEGKIAVVPNGFDPEDFDTEKNTNLVAAEEDVAKKTGAAEKFVVVHTGIMPASANPDKLWKVLGRMVKADLELKEKLLIVTMGQTDNAVKEDIAKNGLSGNFKDLGYVSHAQSVAWQKRADILLLPLRKEKESKAILTGKFFEYLASGKNILAFGPTDGDLAKALKKTGCGTICQFEDETSIREAFGLLQKPTLPTEEQIQNRKQYSRIKQAENIAGLLEEISDGRQI